MIKLRDYQLEMLEAARASYRAGHKRPCLVAPCGAGKTVIVAEMARLSTERGNQVLFLAHRRELIEQTERTFRAAGVDMDLCEVGMVQTMCRRLDRIRAPNLIIVDENHHAKAASYRKVLDAFPQAMGIGVTATPVRLDGSGLGDVNDDLVQGVTAKWLIENGYLAPYKYFAPTVADLSGVKINHGEFDAKQTEGILVQRAIFGDVIAHYRKLANGCKAICYCTTLEHSRQTAAAFNAAGIPAAHIDGDTDKAERADIVQRFRDGEITVLCNVDLISEGFDVPDCSCAILLRPTHSLTLYIQQSMRCMRFMPGKTAIIIDHVGNYARHGMPDDDREWKLDAQKKKRGQQKNTFFIKQCDECYAVMPSDATVCPECGYVFPKKERTIEEITEARLEEVKGFTLNLITPADCRSYEELRAYGKNHGYKPGWAYYQAKQRGLLR